MAPCLFGSAQAARTKHSTLGGLINGHLFLTVQKAEVQGHGASRVRPCEHSLPGLQTAAFSLCPHLEERWGALVSSSSQQGAVPIIGLLPHDLIGTESCWVSGLQHTRLGGAVVMNTQSVAVLDTQQVFFHSIFRTFLKKIRFTEK